METIPVRTGSREEFIDITREVQKAVTSSGASDGICVVYTPHTTAAVTINENADPDVPHDIIATAARLVPHRDPSYRHGEGNSDAHVKSSIVGCSETLLISGGKLVLGTWQSVFFCEFDGPRSRRFMVKVI